MHSPRDTVKYYITLECYVRASNHQMNTYVYFISLKMKLSTDHQILVSFADWLYDRIAKGWAIWGALNVQFINSRYWQLFFPNS